MTAIRIVTIPVMSIIARMWREGKVMERLDSSILTGTVRKFCLRNGGEEAEKKNMLIKKHRVTQLHDTYLTC